MSDGLRRRKPAPKPARVGLSRNNTSYPTQAAAKLRDLHADYRKAVDEDERDARVLKYYQYLVREVMTRPEFGIGESGNGRGLLVYHTMGMGKTLLAIACALAMRDVRSPLVIAPKSLHKNFEVNIEKLTRLLGGSDAEAAANQALFKYVSLDAHNMAKQVARATTGVEGSGSLTGRLLIVDEAHTLFRAIINSPTDQTNARQLYHMVMAAKNLRILFLTGTPSAKDPFELVPCFNMLAGEEILPTQYDVFRKAYVDKLKLKNRGKLANRLLGLVSHVTPVRPTAPQSDMSSLPAPRSDGWYPEVLEPQVLEVEMGADQYRRYLAVREREEGERGGPGGNFAPGARLPRGPPKLSLPGASEGAGGTYFHHSRVHSNFSPDPSHGEALDVARMPDAAFDAESSPKAALLVKMLSEGPAPSLVYSQYVGVGGLAVVARFLDLAGWERFEVAGGAEGAPADEKEARRLQNIADTQMALHLAEERRCGTVPPALRGAIFETAERPKPFSMRRDDGYAAGDVTYVSPRGMCRFDRLMNLHIGQRKLFLSELHVFERWFPSADAEATVVYAGAAGGNHLPYLASLFPNVVFHLYDPNPFKFKPHPRLRTYRAFFTDETARSWKGRCDVFVSDIRIASSNSVSHEENIERDMAAQARWTQLMEPRMGAVLKYRPPYWYGDEARSPKFQYLRGEVVWQLWGPPATTECRLVVSAAEAKAPFVEHDGTDHQSRCFLHNYAVRPWARYPTPEDASAADAHAVPGYDGCFDCAGEVRLWVDYLKMPGAVHIRKAPGKKKKGGGGAAAAAPPTVAPYMELLTRAARGVPLTSFNPKRKKKGAYHGVDPSATGPASVAAALKAAGPFGRPGPSGDKGARRSAKRLGRSKRVGARFGGAEGDAAPPAKPRYAVISGDVAPEDRAAIMAVATSPENRRGELIRAVLGSSVVALGYDFKNIRRVFKFEPYWDKALEDQVDARGIRMGSHDALPPEERDVQSFLLLATANQKVKDGMAGADPDADLADAQISFSEDETINERFHRRALDQAALNGDMRKLLREVSIECGTNDYGECRMCVPTDAPLFRADPLKDLKLADPCAPLEETEVEAKEIALGDGAEKRAFFYVPAPASAFGVDFFAYDADLEAHTPVDPATPTFQELLAAWRKLAR